MRHLGLIGALGAMFVLSTPALAQAQAPVSLPNGVYRITWMVTYDELQWDNVETSSSSSSHQSALHGEYSGTGTARYLDGVTIPLTATKTRGYVRAETSLQASTFPHEGCPSGATTSGNSRRETVNGDEYFNVVYTLPVFQLKKYTDSEGSVKLHYPIRSFLLVDDPDQGGYDTRETAVRYQGSTVTQKCDGTSSTSSNDQTQSEPLNFWAGLPTMRDLSERLGSPNTFDFVFKDTLSFENEATRLFFSWDVRITVEPEAPTENLAPVVDAGAAVKGRSGQALELVGNVADDGRPDPPARTAASWSLASGPEDGEVVFGDASSPRTTATFSRPGRYVLRLVASDSERASSATTTATIVDHYRIEMKAWIPQVRIVDPYSLAEPFGFPKILLPYLGEPLRSCLAGVYPANARPLALAQVTSSFGGDSHQGFGTFNSPTPDYRIRTFVEFDYDGSKITNFESDSGVGVTARRVTAVSRGGQSAVCLQTALADPEFAVRGAHLGDRSFSIGVRGYDPLVPRNVAQHCSALATAFFGLSARACEGLLTNIPQTPAIDGAAQGTVLADGGLSFTFTTDLFPSYGLAVQRNDEDPWDVVANDASCVPTASYLGAASLVVRLNANLNVGQIASDTPDTPCTSLDPFLAPLVQEAEDSFRLVVNLLTEPVLLIGSSRLPLP